MNTHKLVVYKSNEVIEAGYKLTLNEQRIVLACIGQVNSQEQLLKTDEFELSAKDFATIFGVSGKTAYEALIEVTDSLFNRYIVINNPFPHKQNITHLKTRWISSIYYAENEGKITLCFAEKILPYLSQLEGTFTKYDLKHIGNMSSTYGIRLYELLMQWKKTGKREIEIAWLKKQFGIEELYPAMCDFKKRVIEPAIKDISEHSNFTVSWEQRKTGRRVTHLIFTFAEKQPTTSQPSAPADDHHQPPPVIAGLLQLVPEAERGMKTVLAAIIKHEKSHGADYVRRNILYSNINAKGSYRGFLIKALAQDWGHDWELQAQNRQRAAMEKEDAEARKNARQAQEKADKENAAQETKAKNDGIIASFRALPPDEQESILQAFFESEGAFLAGKATKAQKEGKDMFLLPTVRVAFVKFYAKK